MRLLDLIRVRQWIKNILIFFPGVIAINEISMDQAFDVLVAFVAWCLVASAGYVFNDLLDRKSDRAHPIKRLRPLAAGDIDGRNAIVVMVILLSAGFGLAFFVNVSAVLVLLLYAVLNVAYTTTLKRVKYLDVIVLTLFYLLRLFMGSYASEIEMSQWFILTCYFAFLSLSLNKRYMELRLVEQGTLNGRDYSSEDYDNLKSVAFISSYASITFAMLYMVFSLEMVSPIHYVVFLSLATTIQLSFFDDRVVETDDPIEKLKSKPAMIVALSCLMLYVVLQKYYDTYA